MVYVVFETTTYTHPASCECDVDTAACPSTMHVTPHYMHVIACGLPSCNGLAVWLGCCEVLCCSLVNCGPVGIGVHYICKVVVQLWFVVEPSNRGHTVPVRHTR